MKCPIDGETLKVTERSGVEIDYCPVCRGVWLDRGELDKIIDRVEPVIQTHSDDAGAGWDGGDDWDDARRGYHRNQDESRGGRPRRREGLLSELFGFFD